MNVHTMNIDDQDVPPQAAEESRQSLEATLNLLSAVGSDRSVSQRSLADRLGVALGLANALIKRCVRKGFIKIGSAPARRYAYYLTPAGFTEKSRLVGEYIETSLSFFRSARVEFNVLLGEAARKGYRRVLVVGSGELAEIVLLSAGESGIELIGVVDSSRNESAFHGLPVFRSPNVKTDFDAVVIADAKDAQAVYDLLAQSLIPDRIFVPALLHVVRAGSGETP